MNHYSELYGEFVVPNKRLYDLAMEYHARAEQYDQTICENGIPKTSNQMYKINNNAKIILD